MDKYTKVVLTVIAICLVWLCVMRTTKTVEAQGSSSINISSVGGYKVYNGRLNVNCD